MIHGAMRLLLIVSCVLGPWMNSRAQMSADPYDANDVIDALMTYPLPSNDIFWIGNFEEEAPDEGVVRQAKILTVPGTITFRAYDSIRSAETSIHLRVGETLPLDGFVQRLLPADPTDRAIYDDLIESHSHEMIGRDFMMFGADGSYEACLLEVAVVVCGFSSLSWSNSPEGGAVMGAIVGLGLLLDTVDSRWKSSDQEADSLQSESTRIAIEPTRTVEAIPSPIQDALGQSRDSEFGDAAGHSPRERIAAAAVLIAVVPRTNGGRFDDANPLPAGSGTMVSPHGLILTNWHVVSEPGIELSEYFLIRTSDGANPPEAKYAATLVVADSRLDLAVLQVVADGTGAVDSASLDLPFVTLGDSDLVFLGDQIDIYGYPGITDGALTFTQGVVSSFPPDERIPGRAWIATDAILSGGSSGGTAVNQKGELIGIPTAGTDVDCRPGDTNRDGKFDADDEGCIPVGGILGLLRPSNLARDLMQEAGWEPQIATTAPSPTPTPAHTLVPSPTATLSPRRSPTATFTPTPVPTPPLRELWLPDSPPVSHSACFGINEDGEFTQDVVVGRLGEVPDGRDSLARWGWSQGVYRTFGCDGPPQGDAGWIEINLHQFRDASAAQAAVDYFATALADGTSLMRVDPPQLGDYAAALTGPAVNGKDFTVYASQGPLLIRVTGVSPTGIPFANVLTVAQAVLSANQDGVPAISEREEPQAPLVLATTYLPAYPTVSYAECFRVLDRGTYSYRDVVDILQQVGLSEAQAGGLGWTDGAYVVFVCEDPPFGRASQLDIVIHQFQDAQLALPHFDRMDVLGDNESRDCGSTRTLVVCVYGRSLSGSPLSDVHFVLNQVLAAAG